MSDPMQNLNDAADALNQVAARAAGFYDDADAEIAERQAAYDALADNLGAVVADRMSFEFTWDPTDGGANNQRGGVFNSVAAAVAQAPSGAAIKCKIRPDHVVAWPEDVNLKGGQSFSFAKIGTAGKVVFESYEFNGQTAYRKLRTAIRGAVLFDGVDVDLGPQVNGLPFSTAPGPIGVTGISAVAAFSSNITGPAGAGLVTLAHGSLLRASVSSVSVDTCALINTYSTCLVMVARSALTLANGGLLQQGGTVGTSVLTN